MKRLGLLLFTAVVPVARAADWVAVMVPNTEDRYYYDRSKLVVNGSEVSYWKKVVLKLPQTVKGQAASSGLLREQIHCAEHTLRLLAYVYYDSQGNVIEYVAEPEKHVSAIIPDTVGDVFERALCAFAQPAPSAAAPPASATPAPPVVPAPQAPAAPNAPTVPTVSSSGGR